MSVPWPTKFDVPKLPRQYLSNFAESSRTTEANLLRQVLDTSASPAAAVVVKGDAGTGKTTSLLGVGYQPRTWARFSDAVYFCSLGQDADPSTLLEDLETVVGAVVGTSEAEEISRLSKRRNNATAATEAIQHLNDRDVLLLIDDVRADERACEVGRSTVFSLVQNCLRQVHNNPGRLRIVVSTRDASVARVLPESCHVLAHPFAVGDPLAREMLCRYADVSLDEMQTLGSQVRRSFFALLSQCGGLQFAIAVAGCGVRDRMESGAEQNDTVWIVYAREISEAGTRLKKTHSDHPGIYGMLQSSLDHLKSSLDDDGVALPFDLKMLFSFLAVMKNQEAVPLPVLAHIWGLSPEKTLLVCTALERLHLISVKGEDDKRLVSVHDIVLDFCVFVLCERPGRKAYTHQMTVKGLELMLPVGGRGDMAGDGCAALCKLCDTELELDACTRDYFVRNIARHMAEAGGQYIQQLPHFFTDYRWIEARMKRSRTGADLSGILDDIQTLLMVYGKMMNVEVNRGLELISDGVRLSMSKVANNPRELAYQLQGRLIIHGGRNPLVDRLLWSLDKYAKRPWLRIGGDVLEAAGGSVVLKASLPQALHCVAVLPNGEDVEDVVIAGAKGYLAVFSVRYSSELYKLRGHDLAVRCVTVCAATQKIFGGGADGTTRTWAIGTGQEGGNILVRHERGICSLAVITERRWFVFGDVEGWLVVCDSISRKVRWTRRGHKTAVVSVALHEQDGMIVSGSKDGTIRRWEVTAEREIGSRIDVRCQISSVAMSRDGKKIAYGGSKSLGVVDASSGDILQECSESDMSGRVKCVAFGSDDETVHFGTNDGSVAALAQSGSITCEAKVHTAYVSAIAQLDEGRLLVSVSNDSTLQVQNLKRFESVQTVNPKERYLPRISESIAVLPDRNRVLYSYQEDRGKLRLLDLGMTSADNVTCEEELAKTNEVITVGQGDGKKNWVTAVAVSRDGSAVLGTLDGQVSVCDTGSWSFKRSSVGSPCGSVEKVAVSNDSSFMAKVSIMGGVALFRLEQESELQLPYASECPGYSVETVAFNEESTWLLAIFHAQDGPGFILHIWKHIDRAGGIQHVEIPLDKISSWLRLLGGHPTELMATNEYIAIRVAGREEICVYDLQNDQYKVVTTEEEDPSGILQGSNQEHRALEKKGCLFMRPFEQVIRYCYGSGSEVLGTLEQEKVIHGFHPDQCTFCEVSGLFIFIARRLGGQRLLGAELMTEDGVQHGGRSDAPSIPLVWKESLGSDNGTGMSGTDEREYRVFISHAGPDKDEVAIPLFKTLEKKGIRTFVDDSELQVGEDATEEMQDAMNRANVSVFILSPEFAGRRWPLKELICFLERRNASGSSPKTPALIPVFYRLGLRDCQSQDLYRPVSEFGHIIYKEKFFDEHRLAETSIKKARQAMGDVTKFTGIEMREEWSVDDLINQIASKVEVALRRQDSEERRSRGQSGNGLRGREDCEEEVDA